MSEMPNFDLIKGYFEDRLTTHGATPRGVDWNSDTAQEIRYAQLVKIIDPTQPFSLLDYGCGYGGLADYLLRLGYPLAQYTGYDISDKMVATAVRLHPSTPQYHFTTTMEALDPVDYCITSGTFNIKLEASSEDWTAFISGALNRINTLCRKGFSFNLLTAYSDPEYMRPNLYYADPCFFFDYCKRHFSRNVALLHDYEVYDFTILVRKATG